jgi:predicted DNA-binding WGR domain protein
MPAKSIVRRFEFTQGKSQKFWEIVVQGKEVTVGFGRIGTAGQREKKTFTELRGGRQACREQDSREAQQGVRRSARLATTPQTNGTKRSR